MRKHLALVAMLLALGACSHQTETSQSAPTRAPSLQNPINFPLYANSKVLSSKNYTQVINAGSTGGGILSQGDGTYAGQEVIAASNASFAQLRGWLHSLESKPPSGYSKMPNSQSLGSARESANNQGIDFTTFQTTEKGKPVGLLVIAMDPVSVTRKLGPALQLISKYKTLPGPMRQTIDDQVKQRTGFSVSEATQPDSPVGAALEALAQFQHTSDRAILLLNAQKQ